MKNQALFSSKDKSRNLKCRLLQFLFGAFGALTVEDITESRSSASYLDYYLFCDKGKLSTRLYDKREDFNFPIVSFTFLRSNIPLCLSVC